VAILVDYRCTSCGQTRESRVPSPPPQVQACGRCGAEAQRLFAAVGLTGGKSSAGRDQYEGHTDVIGSCAMHPEVSNVWSARISGDERKLDKALAKQEKFLQSTGLAPNQLAHGSGAG
jgi:putative FmdB family regulatory protein